MKLTVAVIGSAHGLRGEVSLHVRTDNPQERLAVGTVLETSPADLGPLEILSIRAHKNGLLARFVGICDRNAAEALRGTTLVVDAQQAAQENQEEDAFYPFELQGLPAYVEGQKVGTVLGVNEGAAHDYLLLEEPSGAKTLIPFVRQIVTLVDLEQGKVCLNPPGGILQDYPSSPLALDA